jgi:hypothetical protein
MNTGLLILLIFAASSVLVAVLTIKLFRWCICYFGLKEISENGFVLTEHGVETFGVVFLNKRKVPFAQIRSVKRLPYHIGIKATLVFRYGCSIIWTPTRPFSDIVVIELKGPSMFRHLLSTPKNAAEFVEQLTSRIEYTSMDNR